MMEPPTAAAGMNLLQSYIHWYLHCNDCTHIDGDIVMIGSSA